MQSILQYRRFGAHVKQQIDRDQLQDHGITEKDSTLPRSHSDVTPLSADDDADLEKGIESPSRDPVEEDYRRESVEENNSHDRDRERRCDTTEAGGGALGQSLSRASTQRTMGTRLGLTLTGIDVRDRTTNEGGDQDRQVFVVGFEGDHDQMNPHNWSITRRMVATFMVAAIGAVVGIASSIDSSALREAAAEFHVSEVVESLATGLYLIGFGVGSLVAGPFSETLGRNPVYIVTLFIYMIFIMASALAPNIAAQLVFRFLAGFFGSTPLTCAGGSIADMWTPMERVYAFPIFANAAFSGPLLVRTHLFYRGRGSD